MTSYSSNSSSLANISKAVSLSTVITPRNVPAGTLPPGTLVTVGKHNVTIERWLSEGRYLREKMIANMQGGLLMYILYD